MVYSGIGSVTTAVAQVLHNQYKDEVIKVFGETPELEYFERWETDLSALPPESLTFKVLTGEGSESVGPRMPSSRILPGSREPEFEEGSYNVKEYDSALEFGLKELDAMERGMASGDTTSGVYISATDYIATVIGVKKEVLKHKVMADIMGDGSGVIGQITSVAVDTNTHYITLTLNQGYDARGFAGMFRLKSNVVLATSSGALCTYSGGTGTNTDSLQVQSIDVPTGVVVCKPLNSSRVLTTLTATTATTGDYVYFGDASLNTTSELNLPDLSGAIADYDLLSAHLTGLGALVAADGRKVQGLTRSGLHASIVQNEAGGALSMQAFGRLITKLKRRWQGMGSHNWKTFILADDVLLYLMNAAMADRRLIGSGDGVPVAFGNNKVVYKDTISGKNESWEFLGSLFCPLQQIYLLPDPKAGNAAFCFPHTVMESVFKGSEGEGFLPKPSTVAGRYDAAKVKYETMYAAVFSKIPAALGKVTNFALS